MGKLFIAAAIATILSRLVAVVGVLAFAPEKVDKGSVPCQPHNPNTTNLNRHKSQKRGGF
jgi:hypothetical protein